MITREINMEISPEELARELWVKNDEEQVIFLNKLGSLIDIEGSRGLMQLEYIMSNYKLDCKARNLITELHNRL